MRINKLAKILLKISAKYTAKVHLKCFQTKNWKIGKNRKTACMSSIYLAHADYIYARKFNSTLSWKLYTCKQH